MCFYKNYLNHLLVHTVMGKPYNFKEIEQEVLAYWADNQTYQKIKKKNHGHKKFYFLQGPPYTSGRLHLGQTWNHTLKDMILRFKRMNGFDVWDRGGYDMHGLPTENKVQKNFDLHTKKDILAFGLDKFSHECQKFSEGNAIVMSDDLWKTGVWLNNDNAYMPIHNSFMEGEWFLIKKAHEKNRLYKGNKVMTWCKSCETALAKHELEYKTVKDNSIFVKFKIAEKEDEYLIIWTTTPWTIPFNLAVMVNPELDYIRAKVLVNPDKKKYETWIVSLALSGAFINGVAQKDFETIEEFKGEKLLGLNYEHPFGNIIENYKELKKNHKNVHSVILSEEYVDTSAGTGLVHCAPGCGPEDFEVGKANNIPAFNNVDELGIFPLEMKRFAGMTAKDDDNLFIDILREKGALIETNFVEHEYAHCWRCKNPVIFRLTDQWFFKVEDLKDKMIEFNRDINWYPETAKNAFDSWLKNLKDNSITRQRYWGTPVPIWQCTNNKCNKYEVIGSIKELKEKAVDGKIPNNLHKPWIDKVKLKCECGHEMNIEGDVLDVWIDAGTTSWNCLDYPDNTELFKKYFPADFIIEGKDQIRGWFNLLMVASTLAFDKPPFKNVCMHGFITDVEGEKMSKSLGNIITPGEITEKYGADTLRYFVTEITAGEDMSFSWDEIKLKHKNLMILWNLHNFLIDFQSNNDLRLVQYEKIKLDNEEKYILSRLHSTIKDVTNELNLYHFDNITHKIEELYMDLSRTYIQLIREKSVIGTEQEKETILYTMFNVFINVLKMFSTISPFITEKMYWNLKAVNIFGLEKDSIHDYDWPAFDSSKINVQIENDMKLVQDVMQSMLSCRDKLNMGVRWPVAECIIDTKETELIRAIEDLKDLIMQQVNVKKVTICSVDVELRIKPNFKMLGKDFGANTARVVEIININEQEIAANIKSNKAFYFEGFEITTNHVVIEKICPQEYVSSEMNGATIYLDKRISKELEEEGFAREVMRRTQQLRKDSGLSKKDVILLSIDGEVDISKFDSSIREKVGAKTISYGTFDAKTSSTDEKIKGKVFKIGFEKE